MNDFRDAVSVAQAKERLRACGVATAHEFLEIANKLGISPRNKYRPTIQDYEQVIAASPSFAECQDLIYTITAQEMDQCVAHCHTYAS